MPPLAADAASRRLCAPAFLLWQLSATPSCASTALTELAVAPEGRLAGYVELQLSPAQKPAERAAVRAAHRKPLQGLVGALAGVANVLLGRAISDARDTCNGTPLAPPPPPPAPPIFDRMTWIILCVLFGLSLLLALFYLAFAIRKYGGRLAEARRRRKLRDVDDPLLQSGAGASTSGSGAAASPPEPEQSPALPAALPAVARRTDREPLSMAHSLARAHPWHVRWGFTALVVADLGLSALAMRHPYLVLHGLLHVAGEPVALPPLYDFDFGGLVGSMWSTRSYPAALMVAFASYCWPFVKLLADLGLWWAPPRVVSAPAGAAACQPAALRRARLTVCANGPGGR